LSDNNSSKKNLDTSKVIKELESKIEAQNKEIESVKEEANQEIEKIKDGAESRLKAQDTEYTGTLIAKNKEIEIIKEKTSTAIKKIKEEANNPTPTHKTDLVKGVIEQNTYKGNFRNGYSNGTVEKEKRKIRDQQKKDLQAKPNQKQ